jgi:hypothetical protein
MLRNRTFSIVTAAIALLTIGLSASVFAGPVGGPKSDRHRVEARSADRFEVTLRGGEVTTIVVSGDGDTDLDLYVYDENGGLVGCDEDPTDDCLVLVRPRWTGPFTIVVRNRGSVWNAYRIAVF